MERTLHRSGAALGRSHPSLASLLARGLLGLALLVSVAGRAAAASCATANPSSLAFGNQNVGSPATRTFNILNCGDVALVISSAAVTGANPGDFARGYAVQDTIGRIPVPDGHPGTVGLMGFGEMLPYYDNRITVHPRRTDAWKIQIPRIRLQITDNERALMRAQVRGRSGRTLDAGANTTQVNTPALV